MNSHYLFFYFIAYYTIGIFCELSNGKCFKLLRSKFNL